MKIRGKVEVYSDYGTKDQKLVSEDDNLIVDGAGEIVVNMLTTTPSLSGIASASAILDTSNYTIQAMTFGKDEEGYKRHAHTDTWSGLDFSFSKGASGGTEAGPGTYKDLLFSGAMVFVSANTNPAGGVSSYFPSGSSYKIMPRAPVSTDKKLELNSNPIWAETYISANNYYASPVTWNNPGLPAFGSSVVNRGHNLNTLLHSSGAGMNPIAGTSYQSTDLLVGAYPRGVWSGGTSGGIFNDVSELLPRQDPVGIASATFVGNFNTVSSMDLLGHLGQVYQASGVVGSGGWHLEKHPNIQYSGIVVSGSADFSSTGEVAYSTVIGAGDLGFTNFYGGIYNIGLWALDIKESLKVGVPPYIWDPISNVRKYKLFSKKSFTKNLAHIQDKASGEKAGILNYKDLTLIWRLYF
jgi:hypothetical protein